MAAVIVVIMVLLISIPLGIQSLNIYRQNVAEGRAAGATRTWLRGSDYRYVSATATDQAVTIVVVGKGTLPPEDGLRRLVAGRLFGRQVHFEAVLSEAFAFETR